MLYTHEIAKAPTASVQATGIVRTFERELGFLAVAPAGDVVSAETTCLLFRPITSQTSAVARMLNP